MYHLPERILFEAFEIPALENRGKSLEELNREYYPDVEGLYCKESRQETCESKPPNPCRTTDSTAPTRGIQRPTALIMKDNNPLTEDCCMISVAANGLSRLNENVPLRVHDHDPVPRGTAPASPPPSRKNAVLLQPEDD